MKKILALTVILAASSAAYAGEHEGKFGGPDGKHHGGKRGEHFMKQIDTDNDGVITKDESRAFGDKMFAKGDTNGDGKITKEEREAAHAARKAEHEKRRAEFKEKFDTDKDGKISDAEKQAAKDAWKAKRGEKGEKVAE